MGIYNSRFYLAPLPESGTDTNTCYLSTPPTNDECRRKSTMHIVWLIVIIFSVLAILIYIVMIFDSIYLFVYRNIISRIFPRRKSI